MLVCRKKCLTIFFSIIIALCYEISLPPVQNPQLLGWRLKLMSSRTTKPTKWHVRTGKTQISLGIHPVWSASSLSAWRNLGSLATHKAHRKDSDQTGQMPRLIRIFAGRKGHFVGFVVQRLICVLRDFMTFYPIPSHWRCRIFNRLCLLLDSFKIWN